jgi:hypothetical protein
VYARAHGGAQNPHLLCIEALDAGLLLLLAQDDEWPPVFIKDHRHDGRKWVADPWGWLVCLAGLLDLYIN